MNISNEIQTLRKKSGLTQEGLAEKIGVSRQSVTKWENGETLPEIERLIQMSDLFRVTLDSLIKGHTACSKTQTCSPLLPQEDMMEFLCEAKKNTYAGKGAEIASSRKDSHDLFYKKGNLSYLDSYFGSERFAGEEVLRLSELPVWSMNYMGRVLTDSFSGDFLKESLSAVSPEYPYRGPSLYSQGEYTYHCKSEGDFSWFRGEEEIYYRKEKIYECLFHGGNIIV